MTQNNVDTDFVDGLQLIIDSLIKEDEGSNLEDEESNEIEKALPLAALGAVGGAVAGAVGDAVGQVAETGADAAQQMSDTDEKGEGFSKDLPEADHWCPDVMDWHTSDHEPAKAPSVHINVDTTNGDDPYKSENADEVDKEYDQNTNLPPEFGKPDEGESVAEPFLRKRESMDEDIEKQEAVPSDSGTVGTSMPPSSMQQPSDASSMTMAREYIQSFDVLKIWASVDRALPKDDDIVLVDDLSILKSFGLGTSTNIEDLVEGTLVHKMLVDRATRPTKEWWEAGIKLAEDMDNIEEPAICTAFLYYEPDTFNVSDFQKADPGSGGGETQDVQNVGSASPIDGLGMSADELPPEDKDCDT